MIEYRINIKNPMETGGGEPQKRLATSKKNDSTALVAPSPSAYILFFFRRDALKEQFGKEPSTVKTSIYL